MVPLDGSNCSKRALNLAISLAKNKDITISGINVLKIPMVYTNKIKKQAKIFSEIIIDDASETAKRNEIPFKTRIISNGYAGKEIVQYAEKNKFDLIIMGSRGPHPIAEMFLGSIANYVVTKSKIPVMIVK